MTLRELLQRASFQEVFEYINEKDNSYPNKKPVSVKVTVNAYMPVIKELLSKPLAKAYPKHIHVEEVIDDGEKYADVYLVNTNYVAPKPGLKPWGGSKGSKIPKGHYNCNLEKYNKRFAFGFVKWGKLIDTPIENHTSYDNNKLLAEILWELTFYGWTEANIDKTMQMITGRVNEAKKQIKSGKYKEISSPCGNGIKIIVPDCVQKQLDDISDDLKRKK